LDETATAIEQLSEAVRITAASSQDASRRAEIAVQRAEEGQRRMYDMNAAMDAIQASSAQIEGIVAVINDIASQTNILALNAAVEAARAGEHGRSFAVVADEVRSLATKAARAARDVKQHVRAATHTVSVGRAQARGVSRKFELLLDEVRVSNDRLSEISTATREQTETLREINGSLTRLDHITEQNRALVDTINREAELLNRDLKDLDEGVDLLAAPDDIESTHPLHRAARDLAQTGADRVSAAFASALATGSLTTDILFDRRYTPIEGASPQRFEAAYTNVVSEILYDIHRPLLESDDRITYAGPMDDHGYWPVGDGHVHPAEDRAQLRESGRLGRRAVTNETVWQSDSDDDGGLFFDVAVPIVIDGRCWGAFRVGYKFE
ncbi:MAG: methyl-accepting chemotaxis protein, partial [Myxococcota bacterium]